MNSTELRTQRAALVAEARKLLDHAEAEKRDLNEDEQNSYSQKMQDVDELAKQISKAERSEHLEKAEAELRQSQGRKVSPIITRAECREDDRRAALRAWALQGTEYADNSADMQVRAANAGINLHSNNISLRALSIAGGGSTGAYTVPTTLSQEIEVALKYYNNCRNFCRVIQTSKGENFDWPTSTDVANEAAALTEGSGAGSSTDPTFGKVTFKALKLHSGIVKVSVEMLQDSIVNIEQLLARMLAERIARKEEDYFVNGAGSTVPSGILTTATVGVNLDSGNGFSFAKLKALEYSVDLAYRQRSAWLMHDATWQALEQLADEAGRPLINSPLAGLQDATSKRLFGYPVYISNKVPNYAGSFGDNKPLIAFGPFGDEFVIRDVAEGFTITRLNELYAANQQIGFQLSKRVWSELVGPAGCIKTLNSYDS